MTKHKYEIGDQCWYANGHKAGKLVGGKVLQALNVADDARQLYLIVTETHIDPIYVVRDAFTMSASPEGPLLIWDRRWD